MKLLLIDTETNGLPKNRYAPIADSGMWPAILQLSWKVCQLEGRTLTTLDSRDIGLALDRAVQWDTGAATIHGLEEAECRYGTAPAEAFTELRKVLKSVDCVVAHNLAFDKPVLRAAAWAVGIKDLWPAGITDFCTMRATQDLVRLPSPYYGPDSGKFKAPRLNELYTWLYGHVYDISGAVLHTAKSDTHCLYHCLLGLLKKGYLESGVDSLSMRSPSPLSGKARA
jgi:DNA polymerase III epsilon subunit-like protein